MTMNGKLKITEKDRQYIEKYWGKIEALTDDDVKEVAEELTEIQTISFADIYDDELTYTYEADEIEDDEPYRAFTEEYLNSIGMSKRDF